MLAKITLLRTLNYFRNPNSKIVLFKVVFLDVKIAKNVQNRQNCKKCSKSNHPNVQKTIMKGRRPNPSVMYNLPYP